jgi:hypothetical protein
MALVSLPLIFWATRDTPTTVVDILKISMRPLLCIVTGSCRHVECVEPDPFADSASSATDCSLCNLVWRSCFCASLCYGPKGDLPRTVQELCRHRLHRVSQADRSDRIPIYTNALMDGEPLGS